METSGPTSGIPARPGPTGSTAAAPWRPGQLLQATVTESAAGKVLLTIGQRQLSAETSLRLQNGQQLTLQVQSLGKQPVLRIVAPAADNTLAAAARLLLPRQGPMSPLLSSLSQLAVAPQAAMPGLVKELMRSMVRQMPTPESASTPRGLKQALGESGVFLERHLLASPAPGSGNAALGADLKANLLRLLQLLRNWPPAGNYGAPPAAPKPDTAGLPATSPPAAGNTSTPSPAASDSDPPAATPQQLRRAVQSTLAPTGPKGATTPHSAPTLAGTAAGTDAASRAMAAPHPATSAPPPLPGSVPSAQTPVQVSLDLLNRFGNLRTDLLQQTEAALARIQMNQLAALPRDAERGLLEWLFELPIRRGDELDLWCMRLFREPSGQARQDEPATPEWSVQLAFDLPGLGPMQAQVRITQHQVSTQFWVEHTATLSLLREHLPELRQALLHSGLEVGELDCHSGRMQTGTAAAHEPLISEKA